jgi:hypothetical protein
MNEIDIARKSPPWPSESDKAILYAAFEYANSAMTFTLLCARVHIADETSVQLALFVIDAFQSGMRTRAKSPITRSLSCRRRNGAAKRPRAFTEGHAARCKNTATGLALGRRCRSIDFWPSLDRHLRSAATLSMPVFAQASSCDPMSRPARSRSSPLMITSDPPPLRTLLRSMRLDSRLW